MKGRHSKTSSKASTSQRPSTIKPIDRLLVLEKALLSYSSCSLRQQQDKMETVDGVVDQLEGFVAVEEEVKELQARIDSLGAAIQDQGKFLVEVAIEPPVLQEGLDEDFREVHRNVADIESAHLSATLKQQLDLKASEIVCKERILALVQETSNRVNQARSDLTALVEEFETETRTTFQTCRNHVEAMKGRCAQDEGMLTDAMDEELIYGKAEGSNWLRDELFHIVDRAVEDMKAGLERRFKQLQLIFKQEQASLKKQFDDMKAKASRMHSRPDVHPEEVIEMHADSRNSLFTLEKSHRSRVSNLAEVLASIKENVQQVSAEVQLYLHSLRTDSDSERAEPAESKRTEFEEMFHGVYFQIEMLRKSVNGLESNLSGDLYKASERLKSIELSSSILGRTHSQGLPDLESLSPRLRHVQEQLPPMVDQLKAQVEDLAVELRDLWIRLNEETGLNIPLLETDSGLQIEDKDVLKSFFEDEVRE